MEWLGVGTSSTWHGYPDVHFKISSSYTIYLDTPIVTFADSEEGTPGNTTAIVAKLNVSANKLMQLVATCVVGSFTENDLHEKLHNAVPTDI